ncbi:uncharacterized protein LOC121376424 isoform X2 [Gigantopelta aegis]|uniref:uncharacterized protein LOC121376424 isoform X2 n=1 Tax=Gigantopelta aegis TaxID=1735272 RepID=UPI001B888280|nr:uncharacterized protein LOC121376424 isoform X2 [Gigantopelta aegis]
MTNAMKTYFFVLMSALTLVLQSVDGFGVISPEDCRAFCYDCQRRIETKRGDMSKRVAADELVNVHDDLDLNGDRFVELDEIAQVTGLKVTNSVLKTTFSDADKNHDGKLNLVELKLFYSKSMGKRSSHGMNRRDGGELASSHLGARGWG